MPWVARLNSSPKLSGGYTFVKGHYYIVIKHNNLVQVIDVEGKKTTVTKDTARDIFDRPQWAHELTTINWKILNGS